MSRNNIETATVETLTAEVRVLQMGTRQITLSVYKQLDHVSVWDIQPFGRVRSGMRYPTDWGGKDEAELELVGADGGGRLVGAYVMFLGDHFVPGMQFPQTVDPEYRARYQQRQREWIALRHTLLRLPLIVLAGSR